MRAMSLDASGKAEEDNELSNIKIRLEFTNNLVASLSKQLDELNERVKIFIKMLFLHFFFIKIFYGNIQILWNTTIFIFVLIENYFFIFRFVSALKKKELTLKMK